jgi:hypothetical protein
LERRPSLSPPPLIEDLFNKFGKDDAGARNEDDVCRRSLPTTLGGEQRDDPSARIVLFGNEDDTASDLLKKPKPDLYWGLRAQQINRQVRQDLSSQVTPSTKDIYPAPLNFFLEFKDPDG